MLSPRSSLLAAAIAGLTLCAAPGSASAETAYGLTSTSQIIRFDTANPAGATLVGTTSGLGAGQQLVGIDFQPSSFTSGSPTLFALGYNATTNVAQLYTVNLSSGALTAFGTASQLGTATSGSATTAFGFDFNPTSGGIRITASAATSTGQNNFRFNATGTTLTVDTALAYATGDTGAGTTPQVVGAAYTNNFGGATSTTLYGYDFGRGALVTVGSIGGTPNSPNTGILTTVGLFGAAFQAPTTAVGFDISGVTGAAFLTSQNAAGVTSLYTVNLATGAPTLAGVLGTFSVVDFSVVPEPGSVALSALGLGALGVAVRRRKKA